MYEVFEHTADIGLRVRATDREGLFAEAGQALFSLLLANLEAGRGVQEKTWRVVGDQDDYLLFDWLNELLFAFDAERLVLSDFAVKFDEGGLWATGRGEPLDRARHQPDHEVKAITYHGLKVQQTPDGWLAEIIVDI